MVTDRPPCTIVYEDEDGYLTGWVQVPLSYKDEFAGVHVVPANDLRKHLLDATCWCGPFPDGENQIHNSLDGREKYEYNTAMVN
jgi:hypothetical protein